MFGNVAHHVVEVGVSVRPEVVFAERDGEVVHALYGAADVRGHNGPRLVLEDAGEQLTLRGAIAARLIEDDGSWRVLCLRGIWEHLDEVPEGFEAFEGRGEPHLRQRFRGPFGEFPEVADVGGESTFVDRPVLVAILVVAGRPAFGWRVVDVGGDAEEFVVAVEARHVDEGAVVVAIEILDSSGGRDVAASVIAVHSDATNADGVTVGDAVVVMVDGGVEVFAVHPFDAGVVFDADELVTFVEARGDGVFVGVEASEFTDAAHVARDCEALESDWRADMDAIGLEEMARELDEQLLNTLRWAGLSTRPDRQVFVDNEVFEVGAQRRERTLVSDPLPQSADKQEHMVARAITKMSDPERYDTDARMIKSLLSDGGDVAPKALAGDLVVHYDTILRSLKRLEDVVTHSYGSVELKSQHLAQQLAEHAGDLLSDFGRLEEHVGRLAEKATQLVDGTAIESESAFELWVQKYLEDINDPEEEPRVYLRMGYRPEDSDDAQDILKSGLTALRTTVGEKNADSWLLTRKGQVHLNLIDGTSLYMEFARDVM